jgi:uroporphyrinogen decarboxylase
MENIKNWAVRQINNKTRIAIPIMTHPGIEMIGKQIKDAVQDGEVHAAAINRLNEIFPTAATTVIMDLTLEAEAFGCQIEFQENDMPHILGRLVTNTSEIDNLEVPLISAGRLMQFLKANRLCVERTTNKPVLGGVIGPFSLAGRLYGMSEIMVECCMEPDAIGRLLDKCTQFILNYCKELKHIGCSGVVMAEPAAGLLSNEDCQIFSSDYIKRIVDEVQDDKFMVVLHNCGNSGHCTQAMVKTGADAYHFGNAIDMIDALNHCPKDKLVMGNIDPSGVMKMSSPIDVKAFTANLLHRTSGFDNFVLSTGCDLPPHVPFENLTAFFEALNEYNEEMQLEDSTSLANSKAGITN